MTTVLIVEDQEGLAAAFGTVLSAEYSTRTAHSGERALEQIDGSIDAVILDRRMPGLSGDDVVEALEERGMDVPVAMLTAVEPDVDILDLSIDTYVTKPIDNTDLLHLVEVLLERASYDERVREFFSIVAKRRALERAETDTTEALAELSDRQAQLRAQLESELEEVPPEIDPRENGF